MRRTACSLLLRTLSLGVALSIAVPNVAAAAPFEDPSAKTLYEEGLARFDAGDFEGALEKLDASLEVERTTAALYAKAQSLNKLERCREAVPIYNEVLSTLPENSAARPAVKDALVICAEKMAEEEDEPEPPPVTDFEPEPPPEEATPAAEVVDEPPAEPTKRWYKDIAAPILIGVGAVGVGVGAYFLSEAQKEDARQPEQYDEFAAKGQRVRQLQIQGGVILGVGAALLLTGGIRYIVLGVRDRRSRATAFTPAVGNRWAGVSVAGRF